MSVVSLSLNALHILQEDPNQSETWTYETNRSYTKKYGIGIEPRTFGIVVDAPNRYTTASTRTCIGNAYPILQYTLLKKLRFLEFIITANLHVMYFKIKEVYSEVIPISRWKYKIKYKVPSGMTFYRWYAYRFLCGEMRTIELITIPLILVNLHITFVCVSFRDIVFFSSDYQSPSTMILFISQTQRFSEITKRIKKAQIELSMAIFIKDTIRSIA